jgi:uncharacterized protein (TIGR03067 family)
VAAFAVLPMAEATAQTDPAWVGKRALRTRDGVKLHQIDNATNKPGAVIEVNQADVRVDNVQGEFVWVRTAGHEGWMAKADLVPIDDAIAYFTTRIQQNANDGFAYNQRAIAWNARKDLDNALADYAEAIRISPQRSALRHNRAVVWFSKKEYDKSLADSNDAIQLDANNHLAFCQRGDTYYALKDYDKALADFTEATRLLPSYAVAWSGQGWTHHQKKDHANALAAFNEAIKFDAKLAGAFRGRGRTHQALNEPVKALADFDEAIRLAPNVAAQHNDRAWIFFDRRDYATALAGFNQSLRLDPSDAAVYRNRGFTYYVQKEYAKALADYEEALRLNPRHAQTHNDQAWLLATCPDAQYRNGAKAMASAQRACELSSWKEPVHLGSLAAAHAEAGDFVSAVKYQKQAQEFPGYLTGNTERAGRLAVYEAQNPYRFDWLAASSKPAGPPATSPPAVKPLGSPAADELQGTWVCVATLKDGQAVSSYVGVKAVFVGDSLTWHYPRPDGSYLEQLVKYRTDAARNYFDWWTADRPEAVDLRLFTVSGNELRWSTNLDRKTRPERFEAGRWQFTMKRM